VSISSEFVSVEVAADLLSSSQVTDDQSFKGLRVRRLRKAGGEEVILVEGATGEWALIS
jgi:hypothetical protein